MSTWLAVESWNLALVVAAVTAAVLTSIARARGGRLPRLRRIAGVAAMEDAIGRATEMGRPVVYVAGVRDLDDVQTVASLGILGAVGRMTARHGCRLDMPTNRSLVLAAARETLRASYTAAAHPDAYNPEMVTYVSDDHFAFAARVDGMIARQRPAACFLQGAFFAESLLIAESGAQAGAVQVAGTAITHQLPFLVAACDHVLIGEEFFAAEAYMSGEPEKIGSLRGQDVVKFAVMAVIVLGAVLVSLAGATGWPWLVSARDGLLRLLKAS